MRHIAEKAGVSIGALYHYFPSKTDVFMAVLGHEYDRRLAEAKVLWQEGASAAEVVRRVVELHFTSLAGRGGGARLVGHAWQVEVPALRDQVLALREEYAQCIAGLLSQAAARGEIRSAHPLLTAYALLGLVESVTARVVAADGLAEEMRRKGPAEVAEMAWRALRPDEEGQT